MGFALGHNLGAKDRALAHEGCGKTCQRLAIDAGWGTLVFNVAIVHHHHMISKCHCLFLVMGDVNKGSANPLLDGFEFILHLPPQLKIKCAQGFIQQQHGGFNHQRPGQGHPLALPA